MEAGHSSNSNIDTSATPVKLLNRIYCKLSTKIRQEHIDAFKRAYGHDYSDDLLYAAYLTGLHPNALQNLDSTSSSVEVEALDRATILSELHNFYLIKNSIPTTKELFNALHRKIPPYMTIDDFRKQLVLMDFAWKKIPNYTFVLTERPEVVYERYKYLKRLFEYQEQRKPIYFIDDIDLFLLHRPENPDVDESRFHKQKVMYAMSRSNVLFHPVNECNEEEAKNFVCRNVISSASEETVLVLRNHSHYCERVQSKPTIDSLKCDMTEWLDRHQVPYKEGMSKAELYFLVQKCTDVDANTYVIDNIAAASGHIVLRLPDHIEMLSPTVIFSDYLKENMPDSQAEVDMLQYVFGAVTEDALGAMFDCVMDEKRKLLKNDIAVDNIWDSLVTKMEKEDAEGLIDSDIPSLSDSEGN